MRLQFWEMKTTGRGYAEVGTQSEWRKPNSSLALPTVSCNLKYYGRWHPTMQNNYKSLRSVPGNVFLRTNWPAPEQISSPAGASSWLSGGTREIPRLGLRLTLFHFGLKNIEKSLAFTNQEVLTNSRQECLIFYKVSLLIGRMLQQRNSVEFSGKEYAKLKNGAVQHPRWRATIWAL